MGYNEIVNDICNSKEYKTIVKNVCLGNSLEKDLYQEVILILLEYDPDKIVELHNAGRLRFWFIRVVLNTYRSKNSPFYKKFLKHLEHIDLNIHIGITDPENGYQCVNKLENLHDTTTEEEAAEELIQELVREAESQLDRFYWYDKDLFKLFVEVGSRKEVSRLTSIPFRSVGDKINLVKKILEMKLQPILKKSA